MQTVLKLTRFDFVLSGQRNRKQNSDFRQVQILVSVSRWSFLKCLRTQCFTHFHNIFACHLEKWSTRCLLFLKQTSFYPILNVQIPILAVLDSKVLVNRGRQIGLSLSQWIDSSAIKHNIAHHNAFCITNSIKNFGYYHA